jgi:hypothetical protein
MFKKVWEALFLFVVIMVVANVVVASIRPFMPLLGLMVVLVIIGGLIHVVFIRKKFW